MTGTIGTYLRRKKKSILSTNDPCFWIDVWFGPLVWQKSVIKVVHWPACSLSLSDISLCLSADSCLSRAWTEAWQLQNSELTLRDGSLGATWKGTFSNWVYTVEELYTNFFLYKSSLTLNRRNMAEGMRISTRQWTESEWQSTDTLIISPQKDLIIHPFLLDIWLLGRWSTVLGRPWLLNNYLFVGEWASVFIIVLPSYLEANALQMLTQFIWVLMRSFLSYIW